MLVENKPYCNSCKQQGREFKTCHRPVPLHLYNTTTTMCNACQNKQQWGGAETSLNGVVSTTKIRPEQKLDILKMLSNEEENINSNIKEDLLRHKGIKWYLSLKVKYSKTNNAGEEVTTEPIFRSKNVATTNHDEVDEQLARAFQQLYKAQEEFQREGSGWNLQEIILFEINTAKYQPLMGSSYIPLPNYLATKKAVINIKNEDQKCFVWSVLAQLNPCHHSDRVINYIKNEQDLNLKCVHFPTPLHDIPIFERNNISINAFWLLMRSFPLVYNKTEL